MRKFLFLSTMLCSSIAFAGSGDSYFGGAYHLGKFEESGFPDASPKALKLEYGRYLSDSIAIEGNVAFGLGQDSLSIDGIDLEFKAKQVISLFLKGDVNLTDLVNLYGLLGATQAEFKASAPDFGESFSEKDSGISYGIGIESKNTDGYVFSAEYIMYLSEDDYDYSGINFGLAKQF